MFTAKSLQLLDANNNNISPATNIETIYYEYQHGGLVKRNHLFKHFPVYVEHADSTYQNFIFEHPDSQPSNYLFGDYYQQVTHRNLLDDIKAYNKAIDGHTNKVLIDTFNGLSPD